MELQNNLNNAINLLIDKIKPYVIYLFGSASRMELREDSDIDIAFLSDNSLSAYEIFMISQELSEVFNREVDLIDLNKSSTVFKVQVVGNGNKIYCNNENRRMNFEVRALKEYALLNEEREVILKKIKESGSVYGK